MKSLLDNNIVSFESTNKWVRVSSINSIIWNLVLCGAKNCTEISRAMINGFKLKWKKFVNVLKQQGMHW